MSLQLEIEERAKEIHTDGYPMSIGEIMSIYQDNEMDIHPEFQRFYRWTEYQKSRLIESILLGIPIPSIFVSQRENGIWDVIDGLQRLSTIFEFAGILRDEDLNYIEPSTLKGTNYLPSLEGKKWNNKEDPDASLTQEQRLFIKRSKLNIQIIKKESDDETKYELFQRLNTGGSPLSTQEIRNCVLVMLDNTFFEWLKNLSRDQNFQDCLSITDRAAEESYDIELALRFFVLKNSDLDEINGIKDIGEFISDKMISFTKDDFDRDREAHIFKKTFEILNNQVGDKAFKKYNRQTDKFQGGFSISAFEVIATGIALNIEDIEGSDANQQKIEERVKQVWENPTFQDRSGSGSRASSRLPHFVPLGKAIFHYED